MEYISIKGIDRPVSRMALGSAAWTLDKETQIHELLDKFVECGGNFLDIGRFYGIGPMGISEEILARWLKESGARDKIVLLDKCCHPEVDPQTMSFDKSPSRVSVENITGDLHYSLERLGTDHFDCYLMHRDDESVPVAELMDRLEQHRREGLIRSYGVSNWKLPRIREAEEYCASRGYQGLSVNSPAYSLANVRKNRWAGNVNINRPEAEECVSMGIAVTAWCASGGGFFSDVFFNADGTPNAPEDVMWSYMTEENIERRRRAYELAEKKGCSSVNIALAYLLHQPSLVVPVIGPVKVSHLINSLDSFSIKLTQEEFDYLEYHLD